MRTISGEMVNETVIVIVTLVWAIACLPGLAMITGVEVGMG